MVINHCFTGDVKKIRAPIVRSVRCVTASSGMLRPPLFLPSPLPGEVLYRVTDYGGPDLARTDNYERWGWVFEKSRLLRRSSFDKRWLKYTVRMEDCTYLCFQRIIEYVGKKKNFYRPPSAAPSVT